jgi:protein-S-isoprenylcysteine O-methyltransferase Ste14
MAYILLGVLGFPVFHLVDVAAIKRLPWAKPLAWIAGCCMITVSTWNICMSGAKFSFPVWLIAAGWVFFVVSMLQLLHSLFINLPFYKTYFKVGVSDELITTGLYAIVRHPGVYGLAVTFFSLVLVSESRLMLAAASIWMAVDIVVVAIQDRFFFDLMFEGYGEYRKKTPMLIPTWKSLAAFAGNFKIKDTDSGRKNPMSTVAELFADGKYDEVWKRCCGFLDLNIDDFMRIQKRLLLEQIDLLGKCELGQKIMNGDIPDSVEEFRDTVPLTTYADYAPYLLKRRMDVLPKKPLLWQYTSGKTGEYAYRWAPITAKAFDEIEPLVFAMMILAAATKHGEVNLHRNDKVLYSMAPPPYATGTIVRAFPHELFSMLPPVEEAEKMPFEERMKKGFDMALSEGMDMTICMSSVAVAIGQRFSRHAQSKNKGGSWLRQNPKMLARLASGMLKAKLNRRQLLPRDLWKMKGLVTFGIDGEVFRDKIKEMWGCYPLDFHGCTEAPVIAMQAWDHTGMTFVPHLNFFEFIPEEDAIRSQEDTAFKPRTLLLNELEPGNYELVITSLHGGPFVRYRLGHMIKILSRRNENLNINIPQMSFVSRIDDQIDIAGFTRLGEKVIWQALERSNLEYVDWVARKEIHEKPVLHIYVEMKDEGRKMPAEKIAELIHDELKGLDEPYSELESFTGLRPLMITLLPQGAFKTYELRQKAAGADLTNIKAEHINPDEDTIKFLTGTSVMVKAREKAAEAKSK